MTPEDAALATADGITGVGGRFMVDPETYSRAAKDGFSRLGFYMAGRAGVLGEVDAAVVEAALLWFEPSTVRTNWEAGLAVMPAADAAMSWAQAAHRWGELHLADEVDAPRLAELAEAVVVGADTAGAPVFAGWRELPPPRSPKARAVHHLNGLRELRGALHGGAVRAVGLRPIEALMVKSPFMARTFGWKRPYPDVTEVCDRWQAAEDGTNRGMARTLAVLSEVELVEFTKLVCQARAG